MTRSGIFNLLQRASAIVFIAYGALQTLVFGFVLFVHISNLGLWHKPVALAASYFAIGPLLIALGVWTWNVRKDRSE